MKRLLLLAALLMAMMQAAAADVNLTAAQASAVRFLRTNAGGRNFAGQGDPNVKLLHTEVNSTQVEKAVYYIFNYDQGFVIVSGDDRARQILAHGDRPLDLNRLPENMKFWLSTYKAQIEYLQAHPGLVVEQPAFSKNRNAGKVEPMLTAEWDQDAPYYNHCPVYNGSYCLTGCPATSLSMVFYYWKYPTDPTPEVEGYTTESYGIQVPALPSITFDWDNMLDKYTGSYTTAQADAVAWLMRYVGQEEHMDYTPSASGAMGDDILRAVKFFGYDEEMARLEFKTRTDDYANDTAVYYNDEEWAAMLQNELYEGRPVVYCGYDYNSYWGWSGHAFNVDGYTPEDQTYHVNWGWSGEANGDFVLNAFNGGGSIFNIEQQMIMGIQPPASGPTIKVNPSKLYMDAYVDQTAAATFTVKGQELNSAVAVTLNDESGMFSIDATSVDASDLGGGKVITVTYAPTASGSHSATITLSNPDVDDKTVTLNGVATLETYAPHMLPAAENYINLTQFRADWTDETPVENVVDYTLEVGTRPAVELLDSLDGSKYPNSYSSITLSEPWSGNGVMAGNGAYYFSNYNNDGFISFTVPEDYTDDVFTVQITTVSGYYGSGNLTVGSNQTPAAGHSFSTGETYTWLVTASAGEKITITSTEDYFSPDMGMIKVYAGDISEMNTLRGVTEEGDANYRLITGITDRFYTVKNLSEAGTFYYKVKATYTDGTQSRWSNAQKVTLSGSGHDHELGDVNHDGRVDITDVTELINYLLVGGGDICDTCADVNGDGKIDISDVTALISALLYSR